MVIGADDKSADIAQTTLASFPVSLAVHAVPDIVTFELDS